MKVISPAGEFEISIQKSSIENNYIVLKGQMGVWDSKIYLKPKDLLLLVSVICKPSIIFFLLKLPILYIFGGKNIK